jgi:hypothetical protein
MSMEVLKQRREEMLPEAELKSSTVVWDLARGAGVLRRVLRKPKNAD